MNVKYFIVKTDKFVLSDFDPYKNKLTLKGYVNDSGNLKYDDLEVFLEIKIKNSKGNLSFNKAWLSLKKPSLENFKKIYVTASKKAPDFSFNLTVSVPEISFKKSLEISENEINTINVDMNKFNLSDYIAMTTEINYHNNEILSEIEMFCVESIESALNLSVSLKRFFYMEDIFASATEIFYSPQITNENTKKNKKTT